MNKRAYMLGTNVRSNIIFHPDVGERQQESESDLIAMDMEGNAVIAPLQEVCKVSFDDLDAFAGCPLSPIGLDRFVVWDEQTREVRIVV